MAKTRKALNEQDFYWKNWRLGTELQISGTFIYNALYFLDTLDYLQNEEDIFEFLYNTAVGMERIQKIVIIMLEHDEDVVQKDFEKSIITHNHTVLQQRINAKRKITYTKTQSKFLALIRDFYQSYRYERFNKDSIYHLDYDKHKFQDFLITELKLEVNKKEEIYIKNDLATKEFLGKIIIGIVGKLYDLVYELSHQIGTFTYEIRSSSKASKIFMAKEYTFETEKNFKREIIISLMNKKGFKDEFIDFIKSIKPVTLDEGNSSHYIEYLFNSVGKAGMMNEYDYLIEDEQITKERLEETEAIGNRVALQSDFDDSWMTEDLSDDNSF